MGYHHSHKRFYTGGKKVEAFIRNIEAETRRVSPENMLRKNRERIALEFKQSELKQDSTNQKELS